MQKIKSMDDEKLEISKQLELLKSELNGKDVIDKKVFEEELAKKQAEFEKGRIMDTAVSLHEYYEKKIDKIKTDYEEKLYNKSTQENTQLLNEIKNLQETNSKLKEEITRLNTNLQLQLKQYTNDKNSLLRQIQQLHSKINTMELEITEYTKINTLLNNQIQELKKLQM
jgi:chromosome segregation ATPase